MLDVQSIRLVLVCSELDVYCVVWNIVKGLMGNFVEQFDVYMYMMFVVYFEDQFFLFDDLYKSIYIYVIFWVIFIMRLFGLWFFGCWVDCYGCWFVFIMVVIIMVVGLIVVFVDGKQYVGLFVIVFNEDGILKIIDDFWIVVLCVVVVGFDVVEIYSVYGYLLYQFYLLLFNICIDGWGSDYDG